MTRHDYAPSRAARLVVLLRELFADAQVRAAAATLAAVMAVIASALAVELHRLAGLEDAVRIMDTRVADARQRTQRLDAIRADVDRLRRERDLLLDARAASRADVNALVVLGNRLPSDSWLTRVHGDRDGSWTLEGRASRTFAVGAILLAAERIASGMHVRLLSLGSTGSPRTGVRFALAWERRSP